MRPYESFIEQPIRSLQTMLRVLSQDDSRYPSVIPDGIYGPATSQAVSVFQRQNMLPVNGVADQITWDAIVDAFETALVRIDKAEPIDILLEPGQVIRKGQSSPYIFLLQSMLFYLSQDHTAIRTPEHTGTIDILTENAISDFQSLAGLESTGELDRITWKHLVRHFTANAHHNMRLEHNAGNN